MARLRATPGVAAVEPDRVRTRVATEPPAAILEQGDPLRRLQGHLADIRWTPPSGGAPPLVAVLDTGVDGGVPDLAGVLDTSAARSFAPGSDPLRDREGHGTHVTGILAAGIGNGIGVTGVAHARILPVKIADQTGSATTSSLVRGINYAVARGARVINISFGGGGRSALEQAAIDSAVRSGAVVVAAAGNTGQSGNRREYPGAYRHVVAVGAVDDAGAPLPVSTRGPQVAIAAPGLEVLSTAPPTPDGTGGYARRTGTSMAAAMVSGAAARVIAARPFLTGAQVVAILTGSARDVGAPGPDPETGAGVLDVTAALAARAPSPDSAEPNDEPDQARRTKALLTGTGARTAATFGRVTPWSDPRDVYRVALTAGDDVTITVSEPPGADLDLVLWRPGTRRSHPDPVTAGRLVAARATGVTPGPLMTLTAAETGVHFVEVRTVTGGGRYRLTVARAPAATG
ncbi:MAG: S8 family serine peptidase, partial [Actinomycetota bacterium]